ncbi:MULTISPECIES: lipase family protein [Prauserella salsuginis group]|uniref:Lipase family protein n=1 Tax=Prauserella salsuginis TaxID=387889 RepID=A0ABW6G105_9PSEU|nr:MULTISPECIES: lipase family protein [Prauserella salsuginis group]MCR3722039.1 Secretory lipase [Prauserella flava]MCR3736045.1 Secretory lipase [Prauserella salsuginis]
MSTDTKSPLRRNRGVRGRTPRTLAVLSVAVLAIATTLSTAGPAASAPDAGVSSVSSPDTDFYLPPSPLPEGAPGTILRSERFPLALALPGVDGQVPANATRIMYRSADTHGTPTAVTGTYLEPTLPWNGPGPRPLIAVAPGTQGQGDQCAPSKGFAELVHYNPPLDGWFSYETSTAYSLLARGMAVVMTDYHGLGTPAMHDYVNRLAEAHAVLDSIRAVEALTGITRSSAIFGYSQGGGAAAAAAELQRSYAPELDVRGTYAGAPPADLRAAMASPAVNGAVPGVIGGTAPGLLGYALNGFAADYPEVRPVIDAALNPAGKTMAADVADTCIAETVSRTMFRPVTLFTTGGRTPAEIVDSSPELTAVVDQQRIGRLTPNAPVLIAGSTNDDVVPYPQVRQLAADWCAHGATVQLEQTTWLPPLLPSTGTGHILEFLAATASAHDWLAQRLAGKPAPSNCSALP